RLLAHVRHVFIKERELVTAHSWEELNAIIRQKPVTALILDPAADGVMNVDAVVTLLKRYPSLPVVAYVVLNPSSFGAIAQLSRQGLENVVLQRFDDSPQRFRQTVERARGNPLKRKALDALHPQLSMLPVKVVSTVDEMFESPDRYRSAQDIALRAEMSTIRLYRSFSLAGLGSPKRLLRVAKLLRAVGYLGDRGYSVRDVAKKVGYRNARLFAEHTLDVFGLTPSRVRSHVAPDDAVEKLVAWLMAVPEVASE
ncbi:MAG: helix-turn-helix domain-containing protein, partial [bacterium]